MESNDDNGESYKKECRICFDSSDGIHFGIYSCRACAAFFRRTVSMKLEYKCRGAQQCPIERAQRNMCRHCRFEKCLQEGMKIAAVQNFRDGIGKRKLSNTVEVDELKKRSNVQIASIPCSSMTQVTSSDDVPKASSSEISLSENSRNTVGTLKILQKMHEGYLHFLTIRKATNAMLTTDISNLDIFGHQKELQESNFDACKKVCQWEARLINDIINTYFHPFTNLGIEEKNELFRSFFCYFTHTDPAYQSFKKFGHEEGNDRLLMPDGGYIKCSELEKFYVNSTMVHGTPEETAKIFRPAMQYMVIVIIGHMKRIHITEIEYVALLGLFLWNDATLSLSMETVGMIHDTQTMILNDLHNYYRSQLLTESEITRKTGELMLLLPKLTRSVFMLRENSYLGEIFDLFEADICCKNINSYGAV
ncbi:unnamed protein product [Auanema sp. JU1783]|nr:unnamed protein product [Auanema sp. JU1783]